MPQPRPRGATRRGGKHLGKDGEAGKRGEGQAGGTAAPRRPGAVPLGSAPRPPTPRPVGPKCSSTGHCAWSQTRGLDRPRATQSKLGAGAPQVPTLRAVANTASVLATAVHSHAIIYLVLFSKWTHFFLSSDVSDKDPRNRGSDMLMTHFTLVDRYVTIKTTSGSESPNHRPCIPTRGGVLGSPRNEKRSKQETPTSPNLQTSTWTAAAEPSAGAGVSISTPNAGNDCSALVGHGSSRREGGQAGRQTDDPSRPLLTASLWFGKLNTT